MREEVKTEASVAQLAGAAGGERHAAVSCVSEGPGDGGARDVEYQLRFGDDDDISSVD